MVNINDTTVIRHKFVSSLTWLKVRMTTTIVVQSCDLITDYQATACGRAKAKVSASMLAWSL